MVETTETTTTIEAIGRVVEVEVEVDVEVVGEVDEETIGVEGVEGVDEMVEIGGAVEGMPWMWTKGLPTMDLRLSRRLPNERAINEDLSM